MADPLVDALARAHATRRASTAYASGLSAQTAGNVGSLYRAYPHLGGTALSLGVAGLTQDDAAVKQAAQVAAVKDAEEGWLSKIGSTVIGGSLKYVKDVTRGVTTTAAAPLELVQGMARTSYGAVREAVTGGDPNAYLREHGSLGDIWNQTTMGAALAESGSPLDYGDALAPRDDPTKSTWFVATDSPAAQRQRMEARAAGLIDGKAITPGRMLATALPVEPGTLPYNVVSGLTDFAATLVLDPVGHGGGKVAKANRVKGVIDTGTMTEVELPVRTRQLAAAGGPEDTGLVDGLRKTVLPEKAAAWLHSPAGNDVVDKLAGSKDFEALRRGTGKKLPVDLLVKLVDADDPITVKNLLADAIGEGAVREAPKVRFRKPPPRLAGMMPGSRIDIEDADDAVEQLDRFQRNVRLPEDVISRNNEALARATTGGEKYQVVESVMSTVEQALRANGVRGSQASRVTRMFRDARDSNRLYYVTEIGENAKIPGVRIGDDGKPVASPHMSVEVLDRYIPLPSARDLKTASRKLQTLRKMEEHWGYRAPVAVADFVTTDLFKVFALALRPAWTVRVVGEEQVRMAAAGLVSMFSHPMSYLSWVVGEAGDGKLSRAVSGTAAKVGVKSRGATDALGQRFDETAVLQQAATEYAQSLNRGSAGWRDRHFVQSKHYTTFGRDEPEYARSWAEELTQLASDPVARELARKPAVSVKDMFWSGPLQGIRRELEAAAPDMQLGVRARADEYIDSVLARIDDKTGGDTELIRAIGTGRLGKDQLTDGFDANPAVVNALMARAEAGQGPVKVKGRITVEAEGGDSLAKAAQFYDQAAEHLFTALGSKPTNYLSRSPVFRQRYWQRLEETLGLLTPAERAKAVRAAKDAGLDKATITRMRERVAAEKLPGELTLEDVDEVAKHFALQETRQLLYSLHERAQVADALRVIFPFGEAWREVMTRWAKLGTENPNVLYRTSQGVTQARENGWFYDDPETGMEMFAYPGSQWLTQAFTGVPATMEARVSGLNMMGQVFPGVGPAVTIPASKIIPESPKWDEVRDVMFPFGEPDTSGGLVESMLPAYLQKFRTALDLGTAEQKRALASTTRDVMAYLYSTGEYDISTPAGQEKLLDEAKSKARALYLIRGLAQSSAPSSPSPALSAHDRDGTLTALHILQADYRTMQEQDPTTATERFLGKYGDFAFLVTIPKTQGNLTPTDNVDTLARSQPRLAKRYPNTFGMFTPGGEFNHTEYARQLAAGTRETVSPEDALKLANQRIATAIYSQARDQVGPKPSGEQRQWLRTVKELLGEKYPGYTGVPSNLAKTPDLVQELVRASKDEALAATDAGQGLALYLQVRAQADEAAKAQGLAGFGSADAAAPLRQWLRLAAERIGQQHPDFAEMWDRVLSREMVDDEEAAA